MSPEKNARITIAEYRGEAVAALLSYGLGEAVYGKTLVRKPHRNPGVHELLVWDSLRWAKSAGYRYYDFGRIDPKAGGEFIGGERSLGSFRKRMAFFKLRLGGEVVFCPAAYCYIYRRSLRKMFETFYPRIEKSAVAKFAIKSIRGYNSWRGRATRFAYSPMIRKHLGDELGHE